MQTAQNEKGFWRLAVSNKSDDLSALTPDQGAELRAAQIQAIVALTPTMMVAQFFNMSIVMAIYWNSAQHLFLTIWGLCGFLMLALAARSSTLANAKAAGRRAKASVRGTRRATMNAMFFGAIWAAPILVMFPHVDEIRRAVLAAISAGMICGGALSLATIWQAALVYTLMIAIPTAGALVATGNPAYLGLAALTFSFTFLVGKTVCDRADMFVASFRANLNLREQGQVISLLLREFEENASDWLWAIDAEGRLTHVSTRMAALLSQQPESLVGKPVLDLLVDDRRKPDATKSVAMQTLRRRVARREAFRDIVLPVFIAGEQRWWSISAKPVLDSSGAFSGYRGVGSDITEARKAEAALERMASFDGLTGLPNRAQFHQKLTQALSRLAANGENFAVLSLDLDRFKNVNDTLGHQVGDLLLIEVSRRINDCLRETDIVARFGGDEFVILQTGVELSEDCGVLAQRLVKNLSAPYEINSQCVLIGASAGVAVAPEHGNDADDLLRNSDLALYRAKAEGKGDFRYFSADMNDEMQSRRVLEIELREALQKDELVLHFQPLVDTQSGVVTTCETLVRWQHPARGLVSPGDFIPIAEETGLIVAIGEWVLRRACEEAAAWPRDVRVAVNVSTIQFQTGKLVALVSDALAGSGLPANRLELEITESVLLADSEETLKILQQLRELGVRISLDDFGTGYSSLSYLSSFRFDKIKIDRSFVKDVSGRPDCAAIIQAITGLAATMGMCTTAEGVETGAELDWLRAQGCTEVQGFLFSKAVPAQDLIYLLGGKAPYDMAPTKAASGVAA